MTTRIDSDLSEIISAMVDRLAWKDGEYHYCVALCRTHGDSNVPPGIVERYLRLQGQSAFREGETNISVALYGASKILGKTGSFDEAFVWLVEQRDTIAKG